ncbi:MAG TPA: heme transporter HemC [Alphaproteobacteria bacterium]|nr:heme transporter HemC [Alphaproteobacteria bacterium]
MFDYFANPTRFMRLARVLVAPLSVLSVLLILAGLYYGLLASPPDYQQGDTVRIMYVHVPAAWLASLGYVAMGVCGLFYIVWRHPLADVALRSMAPVGAMFAFLTLVTGALWGKPMWGAWWVWDARLTSMLILFFFYVAVIALANGFDRVERGSRPAALLALVGVLNVPIVKFSVDWWNTLHQPASLIRSGGVSVDPAMLTPLLLMLGGFHLYFAAVVILRMKTLLIERRITSLQLRQNRTPAPASETGQ